MPPLGRPGGLDQTMNYLSYPPRTTEPQWSKETLVFGFSTLLKGEFSCNVLQENGLTGEVL